jgi:hypothetical protein
MPSLLLFSSGHFIHNSVLQVGMLVGGISQLFFGLVLTLVGNATLVVSERVYV